MQTATAIIRVFLVYSISLLILNSTLFAQSIDQKKPQIAVLSFEGRGLGEKETAPLTDRLRGEIVKTNAFIVLERQRMESILEELGFQQSGCTSTECAIEIGKLLNVQKMVAGSIGKVGSTWTVDISFIDVKTGRIEQSFNEDYVGVVDGLLPILNKIAIQMMPPVEPLPDEPLYISGATAIAGLGFGIYSFFQAEDSYDKYKSATTGSTKNKYRDDTESFDQIFTISTIAVGTSALFYFIYKKYYDDSKIPPGYIASPFIKKSDTVGIALSINF